MFCKAANSSALTLIGVGDLDRSGVFSVRDGRESPVRVRSAKEGLKNRGRVSKP